MNKFRNKLRIFLWAGLAIIVSWLLYMGVVPSGKISYVYDFSKPSRFIGKLTPEDRVGFIEDGKQKIIGEPVYFSLRTPRKFNKAKLILKYKNDRDLPIVETGVLVDKTIWRYDLKPIENNIIDQLVMVWEVINEDGVMFLQREKKFGSVEEFLDSLPKRNEIALYNFDLNSEFIFENYQAITENTEFSSGYPELNSVQLRGPYQFYTYIKNEELDFNFSFFDLNKNDDEDPIDVHLYYESQLIDSRHLEDEGPPLNLPLAKGEKEGEHALTKERGLVLKVANLPEGVYKIEVRVNDDIITEKIETMQQKLAFINKIWLFENGQTDIGLHTDSRELQVKTINPSSLQIIKAGAKELEIKETYKQFSLVLDVATSTEIDLGKDGVIIAGDGVFSFSKEALFNPSFKKVTANLDINIENINYVLANYKKPVEEDKWQIAEAEFNLTNAYREEGRYNFIISIPGLKADGDIEDYIEVDEIKVELEGRSLLEKLKEIFSR
ncbi:MAG: hypothetical protein ABIE43_01455 [Patescibacteria group bacterium]